jgi:NADH-quinone oxidoreductase subunit M
VQKVFFGQVTHQENLGLKDVSGRELVAALPFIVLIVVMGLRPQPILDVLNTSTERFVARAKYASGEGPDNDQKVRVNVRQLRKQVVADATPTPSMDPAQQRQVQLPDGFRPRPRLMPVQPELQPAHP